MTSEVVEIDEVLSEDSDISQNSTIVHIPFTDSTCRFTHVRYFTQVAFGVSAVASSIAFIACGVGPASLWVGVMSGTIGYFLPSPSP